MLSKAHIIYAIRKLLITIPIFLGTSIAIFYVMNLVGSPIYFMVHISGHLSSAAVEKLAVYYQLDKPLWYRYVVWLGKFMVGDMGTSFFSGESVNVLLSSLSWETVKLQLAAITFAAVLGIPIGVKTALKQYSKTDYCVTAVALAGYSMPIFWSGLLMILSLFLLLELVSSVRSVFTITLRVSFWEQFH